MVSRKHLIKKLRFQKKQLLLLGSALAVIGVFVVVLVRAGSPDSVVVSQGSGLTMYKRDTNSRWVDYDFVSHPINVPLWLQFKIDPGLSHLSSQLNCAGYSERSDDTRNSVNRGISQPSTPNTIPVYELNDWYGVLKVTAEKEIRKRWPLDHFDYRFYGHDTSWTGSPRYPWSDAPLPELSSGTRISFKLPPIENTHSDAWQFWIFCQARNRPELRLYDSIIITTGPPAAWPDQWYQ